MKSFYEPTQEQLTKLSVPWCASYSGGKDSTSLVTWLEWLRRAGWISIDQPRLVRSDTGVEEAGLVGLAEELTTLLSESGWQCSVVRPEVQDRLYPQILGRGLLPVHPGNRRLRWCTRSTKIDPMKAWKAEYADGVFLTGLRLGESAMRDGKLKKANCAAGGECGIPEPGQDTYSPILRWSTCQVVDWLAGLCGKASQLMADVLPITRRLLAIYDVRVEKGFDFSTPEIKTARFGCIGCPAIGEGPAAPPSVVRRYGKDSALCELYDVWHEARLARNRCYRFKPGAPTTGMYGYGPIRMAVRQYLLARVLDIQRRAGVVLVTAEDEAFIRRCWADKVYPRGWSEADEATEAPTEPLYGD